MYRPLPSATAYPERTGWSSVTCGFSRSILVAMSSSAAARASRDVKRCEPKGITPGKAACADCERFGSGRAREGREKRERVAFFAASYAQATRFLRELALSSRLPPRRLSRLHFIQLIETTFFCYPEPTWSSHNHRTLSSRSDWLKINYARNLFELL